MFFELNLVLSLLGDVVDMVDPVVVVMQMVTAEDMMVHLLEVVIFMTVAIVQCHLAWDPILHRMIASVHLWCPWEMNMRKITLYCSKIVSYFIYFFNNDVLLVNIKNCLYSIFPSFCRFSNLIIIHCILNMINEAMPIYIIYISHLDICISSLNINMYF